MIISKLKRVVTAALICVSLLLPMQAFAQANYNCDAYGAGDYQGNTCVTEGSGTGGRLSNTGRNILIFGGIGLVGAVGGGSLLYVLLKKRKKDDSQI